jgi:hypothetical protein
MDFITHHCAEFIEERYPRTEALETPILNPERQDDYWRSLKIIVDESRQS